VVATSVVSVAVAIYNTMNERRREIAIMRALGARRLTIVSVIVGESALIGGLGAFLGIGMGHLFLFLARERITEISGIDLDPFQLIWEELAVFAGVFLLSAVAGLLPALKAYLTDVAQNLAPLS
jgi:putative ABC transport system permease protein